jgi:hypothetical protein
MVVCAEDGKETGEGANDGEGGLARSTAMDKGWKESEGKFP